MLAEAWLNMNKIEDSESTLAELTKLKHLKTVYLTDNLMVNQLNAVGGYHELLK